MPTHNSVISVSTSINQSIELTWEAFNTPQHMLNWARSSNDWIVKEAKNDLRIGGELKVILTTAEGSIFLQYCGNYQEIDLNKHLSILLEDGRTLDISFSSNHDMTTVQLQIEAVEEQDTDVQELGWQSLLDNLKIYSESVTEELKKSDSFYEK